MRKFVVLLMLITVVPLMPARAAGTVSDPAAQQIQSFYATLVDTMKRGPQLGMTGRYKALEPTIDKTFDFPTMMQFIVGASWATMSEADKNTLVTAFRRMTIATYASNFDKYSGEQFEVDPNVQTRGPDKLVLSKLIPQGDVPIPFYYRMRQIAGTWKVIDVYLAGFVSQDALKRSDFASTLASQGPRALSARIDTLAEAALAGQKTNQ